VPAHAVAAGNPVRIIRSNEPARGDASPCAGTDAP
jgi:acetyltransferase-like isoleucine patch superfamily enzyme